MVVGCTVTEGLPDIVEVTCIVLLWAKELTLVAVTEMLGVCVDEDCWRLSVTVTVVGVRALADVHVVLSPDPPGKSIQVD